jgi:fatty acid desaturase
MIQGGIPVKYKDDFDSMTPQWAKNTAAIAYVLALYGSGIALLLLPLWQANLIGIVLIVHSLVVSTAMTHEFIHGNIFKDRQLNSFWGQVMTHLNGACYAPWENLVEHHFNHHLHHADFVQFNLIEYLQNVLPAWLKPIYVCLEWLYFPVVEFELRWRVILAPFIESGKQHLRWRNIGLMMYRSIAFGLMAWISWKAVALYFIAYTSFVNVVRFVDAFHHTYEYAIAGEGFPTRDRIYEQTNTFSNLVSIKYPWLNLMFLNFGYHNAHHHNMRCPWYELPELHAKLYTGNDGGGLLPLPQLMSNYHRFRIKRMFAGQGKSDESGGVQLDSFVGAIGVSLLTPP